MVKNQKVVPLPFRGDTLEDAIMPLGKKEVENMNEKSKRKMQNRKH